MLTSKICFTMVLLLLQAVRSYILLTANLDDMHSLAKQIADSPVASQINNIIRRAAHVFKETGAQGRQMSNRKSQMRTYPELNEKQPQTDVRKPQTDEGQPQKNGAQLQTNDAHLQSNGYQDMVENSDQNQANSVEGHKTVDNSADLGPENEKQFIEVWKPDEAAIAAELNGNATSSSSELSEETKGEKVHPSSRRDDVGFVELGRNASFYLNSIKKIFENL